jgi:protein gp37
MRMADRTAIAWTDHTFNAWMGCFKVSQGCTHCYAETLTTKRMQIDVFGHDTSKRRRTGKQVWRNPHKWNREAVLEQCPHRVFLGSLMDIFEDSPQTNEWRKDVWPLIRECTWLDFQLLTKRPENIERMLPDDWPYLNVWLGTSIERNEVAERSQILTAVPAIVHFISYEPAIGPGDEISLDGIDWMIVGGESGPGFRPMKIRWALDMWERCKQEHIAFFFKQSAAPRTEMGIEALGRIVREYPTAWNRRGDVHDHNRVGQRRGG